MRSAPRPATVFWSVTSRPVIAGCWFRIWLSIFTSIVAAAGATAHGTQLTASWVDNSGGTAATRVERRVNTESSFMALTHVPPGTNAYVDTSVEAGTTYCYRVLAYDDSGISPFSDEACGTAGAESTGLTVIVRTAGDGTGTVESNPAGVVCGSACAVVFPAGATVVLSAAPSSSSSFAGWSGGCSGTAPCVMAGNAAVTVTASFTLRTFADVPVNHPFYAYIEGLLEHGITGGCSTHPREFCPDAPVTRGAMAVYLLRGLHGGAYIPPAANGAFADVPATHPFATWIEQLAREGMTGGCGAAPLRYCPDASVTRAQVAALLLRTIHGAAYEPPAATGQFSDVPADDPLASWIEQFAREGITGGCGLGVYCPDAPVTRAQMAVFLVRAFDLPL